MSYNNNIVIIYFFIVNVVLISFFLPEAVASEIIESQRKSFIKEFNSGAVSMEKYFAENCVITPPNERDITDSSSAAKLWNQFAGWGITDLTLNAKEVEIFSDRGFEYGNYSMMVPDEGEDGSQAQTIKGTYHIWWQLDSDVWKIQKHIWNIAF